MEDPSLNRLRAALWTWAPRRSVFRHLSVRVAAVAVICSERPEGLSVLFIRRPDRAGDRWSGDVAFPGGLMARDDQDEVETARREAMEEVGLSLGTPVGRLSELATAEPGRARPMRVAPIVFAVRSDVELELCEREVAAAFWLPIAQLARLKPRRTPRRILGLTIPVKGIQLEGGLLWGLTLSMVHDLLAALSD